MSWILYGLDADYELATRDTAGGGDSGAAIRDPDEAWYVLRRLASDSHNVATLRRIVDGGFVSSLPLQGTDELVTAAARQVQGGSLILRRRRGGASAKVTTPSAPVVPPVLAEQETPDTWISFRVLWDDTGEPVADVELLVTTPSEENQPHTTNGDGLVELRGTPPGAYGAAGAMENFARDPTLEFVGAGPVLEPQDEDEPCDADDLPPGPFYIRRVVSHRVQSGETLEIVAQQYGLTWQQLAEFNFGTTARADVDKALCFQLGCAPPEEEGGEIVFNSADDPGVLSVPLEWTRHGFGVEQTHDFRVRRFRTTEWIRIEDPFLGLLAEYDVELSYADGSTESVTSDEEGRVEVQLDRWSDDGNFVDVKFTTKLREHEIRVFLVCGHANTVDGAWQRLVNLGYVDTLEPPLASPAEESVFVAALEAFQAHSGTRPTGRLDASTARRLQAAHATTQLWADSLEGPISEPADEDVQPKDAVA